MTLFLGIFFVDYQENLKVKKILILKFFSNQLKRKN